MTPVSPVHSTLVTGTKYNPQSNYCLGLKRGGQTESPHSACKPQVEETSGWSHREKLLHKDQANQASRILSSVLIHKFSSYSSEYSRKMPLKSFPTNEYCFFKRSENPTIHF